MQQYFVSIYVTRKIRAIARRQQYSWCSIQWFSIDTEFIGSTFLIQYLRFANTSDSEAESIDRTKIVEEYFCNETQGAKFNGAVFNGAKYTVRNSWFNIHWFNTSFQYSLVQYSLRQYFMTSLALIMSPHY